MVFIILYFNVPKYLMLSPTLIYLVLHISTCLITTSGCATTESHFFSQSGVSALPSAVSDRLTNSFNIFYGLSRWNYICMTMWKCQFIRCQRINGNFRTAYFVKSFIRICTSYDATRIEPICRSDPKRFALFPIKQPVMWEM